jgi:hypothetical protein
VNSGIRIWLVNGRGIDTIGGYGDEVPGMKSAIALDSIGPRPPFTAVPRRVPVGTIFYKANGVTVYYHGCDMPWEAVERVP